MSYEINGEVFHDDRMFLLHVCKVTIKEDEEFRYITLHHDDAPSPHIWGVVFYKNTESYPVFKVEYFKTEDEAQAFQKEVSPQSPLVSLDGQSPQPPMPYEEYCNWLASNGWREFDPDTVFSSPGQNRAEELTERKQ